MNLIEFQSIYLDEEEIAEAFKMWQKLRKCR